MTSAIPPSPPTVEPLTLSGKGLVTGQPVSVRITPAQSGHGVVFYMEGQSPIPARLPAVANTDRGVTLANAEGRFICIVEHFLCAVALAGLRDLRVEVHGAPEMPILDGSAREWLAAFSALSADWGVQPVQPSLALPQAVFYRQNEHTCVYAVPSTHLQVTYAMNFSHPGLNARWVRWDSRQDTVQQVADAVTFGYASELPALQARGLALGAGPENALGLMDDGGYSRPLRFEDEPMYHKVLDLLGDLMLTGLNPLSLKAHVFAVNAGHESHTAFARQLLRALQPA